MQSQLNEKKPADRDRSIGHLLRELVVEVSVMVQNEAELARTEVSNKVTQLQSGIVSLLLAMILLLVGLIGLMLAGIYGLSLIWPSWLSALAIGGGITVLGLLAVLIGRSNLKSQNLTLDRTANEFRKEASFARDQVR